MAQYKFEGDIENINERQLEFINSVIEKQGLKNSKVTFQGVGTAGDNYVANVKRIVVEGENGNLYMIAKIASVSEQQRNVFNSNILFRNEGFIYTKVLPKFLQLQKQADVPEDEQIKYPKCYGLLEEEPNEIMLLEDLKLSGHRILDRFIPLTDYVVRSVLKSLAIWHSLSYVLKTKEPETYNYFKDNLVDLFETFAAVKENNTTLDFMNQVESLAISVLDDKPQYQSIIRDKVGGSVEKAAKMKKVEDGNRFAVIQHGDAWTNNIMFKFEDDTIKETVLIDYQVARNSSPVSDLLYFIFSCTHHEARSEYFNDWLDYYHSELDNSLSNYGLKANYVYPRDQLDADVKRYSKIALGSAIMTSSLMILKPEQASRVKEAMQSSDFSNLNEAVGMDTATLTAYKRRIIGVLESFSKYGLL